MRRSCLLAAPIVCATLLAAGCGSGGSKTASTTQSTATQPPTTATTITVSKSVDDPTAGKAVFDSAGCGSCHTLKAAGSSGSIGPNLDGTKPDLARIVDRVTHGKGPMPSFQGQLSAKQILDVAAFVFQSTHGS